MSTISIQISSLTSAGTKRNRISTVTSAAQSSLPTICDLSDESTQAFYDFRDQLFSQNILFNDPDFVPSDELIGDPNLVSQVTAWKRPPEICEAPLFFEDGVGRYDITQGSLGDCWLLSALACLSEQEALVYRVAPPDQGFTAKEKYCGLFRFVFWHYGQWKQVLVDDRLPCGSRYDDGTGHQLLFTTSACDREFWTSLLEKAYAKLVGSYYALVSGSPREAMKDFTGGLVLNYTNLSQQEGLFDLLMKAQQRQSLIGCSTPEGDEETLENGLVLGHAFSMTGIDRVTVNRPGGHQETVELVRIRNPWGSDVEWSGAWSDNSKEWNMVSEQEKNRINFQKNDDGEFWMTFSDFTKNFHDVDICCLTPESASFSSDKVQWEMIVHHGEWAKNINAGGCLNFKDTFWMNPQYRVTVRATENNNDKGTVFIGLMQKNWRKTSKLTIGFVVFKIVDASSDKLERQHFTPRNRKAISPYEESRDVTGVFHLEPGEYVVVPSTFNPNLEGEFLLRIVAEKVPDTKELKITTRATEDKLVRACRDIAGSMSEETEAILHQHFKLWSMKTGGQINAFQLRSLLDELFNKTCSAAFTGFSRECVRSMVALMTTDTKGKLGFEEFKELYVRLRVFLDVFRKRDSNENGSAELSELRDMLNDLGYHVEDEILKAIIVRYGDEKDEVDFNDFVACCVRLQIMLDYHKEVVNSGRQDLSFFLTSMMIV